MVAIWNEAADQDQHYPPLSGRTEADVAIIGGGITGLTLALQLAESGMRVQVLEAHRVGRSNTGNSTGNLYATLSRGLAPLRRKWGDEVTADVARSQSSEKP